MPATIIILTESSVVTYISPIMVMKVMIELNSWYSDEPLTLLVIMKMFHNGSIGIPNKSSRVPTMDNM